MTEIDPYAGTNALGRGFAMAQNIDQSGARRRAGSAMAAGDRAGARNALGGAGMLDEVAAMDTADRQARREETEAEQATREQMRQFLLRGTTALRQAPEAQRGQIYQMLRPTLEQIYPPDVLQQIDRAHLTDDSLDALLSSLGGERPQARYIQGARGALDRIDPYTDELTNIRQPGRDDPPTGYRWKEDGTLELIPGYVQGVDAVSDARRAPPRARSGGASSGGAGRPAAAPTGGRSLPPGFTIRRR